MDKMTKLNVTTGILSALVAIVLVVAKIWALGQTGALSVAASLTDSAMDLMISLGGVVAILYAAKPADDDHAFGHSSAEDLVALGQSIFIALVAVAIGWAAVARMLGGGANQVDAEAAGIAVMLFSVVVTLALVLWQTRVARITGNRVLMADRLHYIGDLIPNIAAILALWASQRFDLGVIDSVVGLGVSGMLLIGAIRIGRPAWDALMDRAAPDEMVTGIEDLARNWPGLHGFHDLKTRTAGSKVFVNLHIELDGNQTLSQAHDIGAGLRHAIIRAYPQAEVIIHKDPVR